MYNFFLIKEYFVPRRIICPVNYTESVLLASYAATISYCKSCLSQ